MYYVYILQNSKNKKLYIGYTKSIRQRVQEHNIGKTKSTNVAGKWILIYYEGYRDKRDATQREWNLKHHGRQRDFLKQSIKYSFE
ncbi:MAG: GIY-YIG nuclease family protein [Patescibacteria group bacterium]|jgi:putative endonuclease